MKSSRYYISVGARGKVYTLRHQFEDSLCGGPVRKYDWFVLTLAHDRDAAEAKLAKWERENGQQVPREWPDVSAIAPASAVDHSLVPDTFKKHAGVSVFSLIEPDPGFLVWFAECAPKSYRKTADIIRTIEPIAKVLAEREAVRAARASSGVELYRRAKALLGGFLRVESFPQSRELNARESLAWVVGDFVRRFEVLAGEAEQRRAAGQPAQTLEEIAGSFGVELDTVSRKVELAEKWATEQAAKAAVSAHFGTVGERVELTLTPTFSTGYSGNFGWVSIQGFVDADGRTFIYKGSSGVDTGAGGKIVVKATIKEHGERDGVKQTIIARVKFLRDA
jgi:hypothetical protein